ncbi:hypothetical protein [Kingella potus]|uniref:hypothetical protein n=1 Tax=Kingella potus TaxID=265175 RepID=UPI001FD60D10|nr:hypothetical protein [Kingella potus]UOP01965.1 hypothetical protein LVJ84_12335 [Kingella potus]
MRLSNQENIFLIINLLYQYVFRRPLRPRPSEYKTKAAFYGKSPCGKSGGGNAIRKAV